MTVDDAIQLVYSSGRYGEVHEAYRRLLNAFTQKREGIPIVAHGYDYPRLLGTEGKLTVENIGLIALLKKEIGDWIQKHIAQALPDEQDQETFVKRLIDGFYENVLQELELEFPDFSYVDFRNTLANDELWFDEMHPTDAGFRILAHKMNTHIKSVL